MKCICNDGAQWHLCNAYERAGGVGAVVNLPPGQTPGGES